MIEIVDLQLPRFRRGFHLITDIVYNQLRNELPKQGLLHLSIKHTSAALTLNENADPSVRSDFESFINALVPENHPFYTHTLEGTDDMPAHIKSSLFGVSVSFPVRNARFYLGTWQGIYLCEFRDEGGARSITATIIS